jgi:hypothetical protein
MIEEYRCLSLFALTRPGGSGPKHPSNPSLGGVGNSQKLFFKELKMEEQRTNKRVRMNLSQNTKGFFAIDCTAEFETVAECEKELDAAIKAARNVMTNNGLKEVGCE